MTEGGIKLASEGYCTLWRLLIIVGIQELLGHKDVKARMVYTLVLNQGPKGVRIPIDEVSMVSYTDQYKTLPNQIKNTQGVEN